MQDTSSQPRAGARFSFEQATLVALGATAALILLVVTFSPVFSFTGTKIAIFMLGTLLAFALFVVARLTRGSIVLPPSLLIAFVWLLPVAYALSTFFSGVNPQIAFAGVEFDSHTLGFILALAVSATITSLAVRKEQEFKRIWKGAGYVFGVVGVLQVAIILIARIFPNSIAPLSNFIGAFSDVGILAGLGVIGALLAFRLLAPSHLNKILLWVGMIIGFFLLALVNSTTLFVLTGIVALGLLIEVFMRRAGAGADADFEGMGNASLALETASNEVRPLGAPFVALIVSLFFIVGGSTVGNALSSALGTSFVDVRPSWQSTLEVGSHTFASSPLFGSGPGTFAEQWVLHRDRALNETIFWNVDFASGIGYLPTALVTTGIVGTIAWLVFLGFFLYTGVRMLILRLPEAPVLRFSVVLSFLGAGYVLLLSILTTPGPVVLMLGFMMVGLATSTVRFGREKSEWGIVFSRSPRAGFAVVFLLTLLLIGTVFAAYVVVERYIANLSAGQAAQALGAGDLVASEAALNRSLSFAPQDQTFRLGAALGVARMNEIATSETLSQTDAQTQFQAALSASVQTASAATQIAPNNYQNWLTLGGVYQSVIALQIEGALEQAMAAYVRAGELAPTNPAIPYTLAQLAIAGNDLAGAEAYLLEAIALKRDYTQAILLLSQLQVQLGKAAEALQAVEAAIFFAPNDTAALFQAGVLRLGTSDEAGAIAVLSRAVELNPNYANARFFLAVAHAISGNTASALSELQAVATMSDENATAVADDITALEAGRNPFPPSRLRTLGVPSAPVEEPAPDLGE